MTDIFIGIDGGATKTTIIAIDRDGSVIAETETSGSSWREHGAAGVAGNICRAVDSMKLPHISGIVAGMPCYGESTFGDEMLRVQMSRAFNGIALHLTNDVEAGWAGALAMQPGIHLVAGTGSIAFGADGRGNTARCGGWDAFYSDEGSAHWIARRGMELFSKQSDGRLPKGAMLEVVRSELKLDCDTDFIDYIHEHHEKTRKDRASFQLLTAKAARAGDLAVVEIYVSAAQELFMMARCLHRRLDMQCEGWQVSYSGGVFKNGDLILEPLGELVSDSGGVLVEPRYSPAMGAAMMAMARFGGGE